MSFVKDVVLGFVFVVAVIVAWAVVGARITNSVVGPDPIDSYNEAFVVMGMSLLFAALVTVAAIWLMNKISEND